MAQKRFAVSISGGGVEPDSLRLKDLYDILHALEAAVGITASQGTKDIGTDFHLVNIEKGNSADCVIAVDPAAYRAAVRCAAAVANRDLSELPEKAKDSLLAVRRKARAKNWRVAVSDGDGMPSAEITPNTDFITDAALSGPSSIAGKLLRVGGMPERTANIMLLDGRRLTASVANESLTVRLGELLYRIISVDGQAKWRSSDLSLIDFRITGIGEFDDKDRITDVLDDLATIAGGFWDEIDPDEYIASVRSESE